MPVANGSESVFLSAGGSRSPVLCSTEARVGQHGDKESVPRYVAWVFTGGVRLLPLLGSLHKQAEWVVGLEPGISQLASGCNKHFCLIRWVVLI